ncbi:putative G-protein coupled receptor Mth-like 1 [Lucilia cuprina]|nr:putative G-protein coupled receptor Mth-like 1 [Lucilia cuprina]
MNEFLNTTTMTHYNNNKMCKYTTITNNNNNKTHSHHYNMRLPKGIGGLSHHLLFVVFIIMIQQIQFFPGCSALVFMMTPPSLTDNIAAATVPENSQILTAMTQTNMNLTTDTAASPSAVTTALTSTPISTNSPPQRRPPPRVVLNKCCLFGEYLDKSKTCVAGSSELWIPLIYLINRKKHHEPPGTAPKFITFEDNIFPISRARNINEIVRNSTEDEVTCTVEDLELITGNHNIVLFSNGSLFLPERAISLPPSRYCVDQQAALVCFPKSKETLPTLKLKKCCGQHGAYDDEMKKCHIDAGHKRKLSITHLEESEYQTIYGFPQCKTGSTTFAIAGDWEASQLYTESGHLHLPTHKLNLSSSDYCLEYLRTNNGSSDSLKIFACLHHFGPEDEYGTNDSNRRQNAALSFGLVISVVFLAATLVASYLMPSVHHVLHWRCQIYYVFCLFIAELLFSWIQLSKTMVLHEGLCNLVASAMHFFFLSAFFWLNTMCFNIWWTFRDFRPSSLERNQELIRLRLYSAYAWGIPLLIATIAACVNLIPESSLLRPGFGESNCWFSGERLSIFAYFFGPIGILLTVNIMLFVSTTHQLTCGLWKRDDVKSTTEKTALGKVCLKLVVVMGVTWIVDVLSWIVGGPQCWWFVTDFINAIQGVFIFLVVGCQPQVWAACKRFCCPRSRGEITNTTNGVQHSSSSQGLPSMAACGGEITQNTSVANTTMNGGVHNTSSIAKIPMETVC